MPSSLLSSRATLRVSELAVCECQTHECFRVPGCECPGPELLICGWARRIESPYACSCLEELRPSNLYNVLDEGEMAGKRCCHQRGHAAVLAAKKRVYGWARARMEALWLSGRNRNLATESWSLAAIKGSRRPALPCENLHSTGLPPPCQSH